MKNIFGIILVCFMLSPLHAQENANQAQNSNHSSGTVTDIDGNVYQTVTIGSQVWMSENLRTTHYRNGDPIPTTYPVYKDISAEEETDPLAGQDRSTAGAGEGGVAVKDVPDYQWAYGGDEALASDYGRLYTWHVVGDDRGVCPEGWHVPSDSEWLKLIEEIGGYLNMGERANSEAGAKMKETGATYWNEPNTGATNESGFSARAAGGRNKDGTFSGLGEYAAWWSTTPSTYRHIEYDDPYIYRNYYYRSLIFGFSIRCVKD